MKTDTATMPSGLFAGRAIATLPTKYLAQVHGSPALPPATLDAIAAELQRRQAAGSQRRATRSVTR